jgi:putative tricarboxylic transport membrane protein
MCQQGKPYKALNTALYSSITGNFFADIVVLVSLVPLSLFSLKFGPRELTALMLVAMVSLMLLLGSSVSKGLLGVMIGGFFATFGFDPVTSIPRMTFRTSFLLDGIPLVPFVVGIFAFSELLIQFGNGVRQSRSQSSAFAVSDMIRKRAPDDKLSFKEYISCWREMLVGSVLGAILGAIPGPGATMAAFSSYGVAGRMKKNKGRMGTGIIEGVAAAEAGNSATVGPTLIPLLTFGVPGSGIAALFGAALILQGLTPGPGLFTDHMDLMAAVLVLMIMGTFVNLLVSKALIIPVFSRLAMIESRLLVAWLTPLMLIGIYAIDLRVFNVVVLFGAGVLGLLLRRIKVPLAPVAVAMMVAPMLEVHFRRTLILARGSMAYWVGSPLSMVLYLIVFALMIYAWRTR